MSQQTWWQSWIQQEPIKHFGPEAEVWQLVAARVAQEPEMAQLMATQVAQEAEVWQLVAARVAQEGKVWQLVAARVAQELEVGRLVERVVQEPEVRRWVVGFGSEPEVRLLAARVAQEPGVMWLGEEDTPKLRTRPMPTPEEIRWLVERVAQKPEVRQLVVEGLAREAMKIPLQELVRLVLGWDVREGPNAWWWEQVRVVQMVEEWQQKVVRAGQVAEERIAKVGAQAHLDLSDLGLMTLPKALGQLTQLQTLDLSRNHLTMLPETFGQLTQLQTLNLSQNSLTMLPETFGQLTQLQTLNLSQNRLPTIPEALLHLGQLQTLDLSRNRLPTIPEAVGQLTQLQTLDLSQNRLTSLPASMRNLRQLSILLLHHNRGLDIPAEILEPPLAERTAHPTLRKQRTHPADVLDYYFRMQQGQRPLNEAKLILVGHGAVGKTSLVNRLVYNEFDPREPKTDGIRITPWSLTLATEERICLNVWDFGGQEIMHATHQFFLTERSLYVLVLNGRHGHEDVDANYWLNMIASFGGDSPVIVVFNKIREQPCAINRRGLCQKFPAIRDFIETDCHDGTGIEELRQAIQRETDRLEHLRDAFPTAWCAIKDRLAGMQENYLTFEKYRAICVNYGETDTQAQESLAYYLNVLGVALNYLRDPRLRDTHVLNPHWVTNGIYQIITSKHLALHKGELSTSDLPQILEPTVYPLERQSFLLELMCKFEIAFRFAESDGRYLIPGLLDTQQPLEVDNFAPVACLNFEYHYPALPEGLLARFIVRTHVLSQGLPRWRSGVLLQFERNQALVRADPQDKKVMINVAGTTPGRRRLLAVIRSDFEHIHRDYTFEPQAMVPVPDYPGMLIDYQKLLGFEQHHRPILSEYCDGQIIDLNVTQLLSGIDLEGVRSPREPVEEPRPALTLFYSYSHHDEALRNELETHLKILQRQGFIHSWHDRSIKAGDEWEPQIYTHLEQADIVLLLISADFIASDYCHDVEMRYALERHTRGQSVVIPIIIRDVNWCSSAFARLQALPTDGKAVMSWHNRDEAWRNVSEGIEAAVRGFSKTNPR